VCDFECSRFFSLGISLCLLSYPQVNFISFLGDVAIYNARYCFVPVIADQTRLISKYWKNKITTEKTLPSKKDNNNAINEEDYLANYSTEQEVEELLLEIREKELLSGFISPYLPLIEEVLAKSTNENREY
jgi:hypothetical protein